MIKSKKPKVIIELETAGRLRVGSDCQDFDFMTVINYGRMSESFLVIELLDNNYFYDSRCPRLALRFSAFKLSHDVIKIMESTLNTGSRPPFSSVHKNESTMEKKSHYTDPKITHNDNHLIMIVIDELSTF
ncbi:CLUMA_CG008171, isoform A [Clunio marinus]|uniref:CLUMA_CG008171, isoform A n=1 Tax=Clunio marinus TaxID=568069 RepID=A0A1J1I2U5_9DIPT|nr:CLUMA_CG008171, isoform A [Clunio marinus]